MYVRVNGKFHKSNYVVYGLFVITESGDAASQRNSPCWRFFVLKKSNPKYQMKKYQNFVDYA
jgi:hypothetical protein